MGTTKITRPILTLWLSLFSLFAFPQEAVVYPVSWLRADSIRQGDTVWRDVSNYGHHATPGSGTMPCCHSLMNFNKCFELANGEYFSLPVGTNDSRQADVIVVYETYDSTMENALWQLRMTHKITEWFMLTVNVETHGRASLQNNVMRHMILWRQMLTNLCLPTA